MKYYGEISDPKDLVTKEYVDSRIASPFVISSTPPSDTTKIWIYNGTPYYYDSNQTAWLSMKFVTDLNRVSVS